MKKGRPAEIDQIKDHTKRWFARGLLYLMERAGIKTDKELSISINKVPSVVSSMFKGDRDPHIGSMIIVAWHFKKYVDQVIAIGRSMEPKEKYRNYENDLIELYDIKNRSAIILERDRAELATPTRR